MFEVRPTALSELSKVGALRDRRSVESSPRRKGTKPRCAWWGIQITGFRTLNVSRFLLKDCVSLMRQLWQRLRLLCWRVIRPRARAAAAGIPAVGCSEPFGFEEVRPWAWSDKCSGHAVVLNAILTPPVAGYSDAGPWRRFVAQRSRR